MSPKPKRSALGRGLEALISMNDVEPSGSSAIQEIAVDNITPNPEQPRTDFDQVALEELAASIKELGIVQPLTLRLGDDGKYQIIAGERRWRASRMAGLRAVPAYIRTADDSEVTEMALIENIQREDLNAIEVALAFDKLIKDYNLTQEKLSERIGKKRSTIANHLRLLKLPSEIQLGLRDRKLDMGHARALLSVDNPKKQLQLYKLILKDGLSVRRVEELARQASQEPDSAENTQRKPAGRLSATQAKAIKSISEFFPQAVKLQHTYAGKGKLVIPFGSDEQLQAILDTLVSLKAN